LGFNSALPASYEIAVRVGAMVATVFLEATLRPDLAIVAELAAAQVACLEAGACQPVPVPEALLAASVMTSDTSRAASPTAAPEG
jgi:hypothetical protein